jgi:spore maturation protein A
MLNYIWLSLIVIGILVAVSIDFKDITTDKFRSGKEIQSQLIFDPAIPQLEKGKNYKCNIMISAVDLKKFYSNNQAKDILQRSELVISKVGEATIKITVDDSAPIIWREQAEAQRKEGGVLQGKIRFVIISENVFNATLILDPVKFTKLNSVTNDGIVKYAKTAVELAIGLIGIMALWLGVMKIAEASGLIKKLALFLKPLTSWLFPDVPADHPAMGAMIMNISANILGLANAATPLGLKAMEELNKLNRKFGTATDAMCTFLVINTSSVQLIPATVIAIRAAAGSANPTEILGPVIIATTVNTIVGVTAVKLFAKLKIFKKQLEVV